MEQINWLKTKWREIALISVVAIVAFSLGIVPIKVEPKETILKPTVMLEKIERPKPMKPPKMEVCEPTYLLKTDDFLSRRDVVILDLASFENFKVKRIDKEFVGYYYRMTGASKQFYTVYKREPLKK